MEFLTSSKNWQEIKKIFPADYYDFLLDNYFRLRSWGYQGTSVFCPLCNASHKKFISNGCPRCGSSSRHRKLWLFLLKRTNFFNSKLKVIYFAPEFSIARKLTKLDNLDLLTADLHSPRAMQKINIMKIPYPDNYFDVTISVDVLDDVDDDLKAMQELKRIQKVGGWSIHLAPIDYRRKSTYEVPDLVKTPEQRLEHYGAYANQRVYGSDYQERLRAVGFEVEVYDTSEFCTDEEIETMGLKKGYKIYYLKKSS